MSGRTGGGERDRLARTRLQTHSVTFDVATDDYGRFMGRFSEPLAAVFADHASLQAGQSALDVGCGPGVVAAELATRLGTGAVTAFGPSQPFVEAARRRLPGVDVRLGACEALPLAEDLGVAGVAVASVLAGRWAELGAAASPEAGRPLYMRPWEVS